MTNEQVEKFITMQEDVKYLKQDVSEIKGTLKGMDQKMDDIAARNTKELVDLVVSFEKKYAGKWVEKVLWGAGGLIFGAIVVALMNLIIINKP